MVITFSFVDVTGTSDSVEWIEGDPFCQTRVGNETNPFVQMLMSQYMKIAMMSLNLMRG